MKGKAGLKLQSYGLGSFIKCRDHILDLVQALIVSIVNLNFIRGLLLLLTKRLIECNGRHWSQNNMNEEPCK